MNDPSSFERQTRVRDLFEEVSSLPGSERSAFLDQACGEDEDLHREVTSLLLETESVDSPIEGLVSEMIWPALKSLSGDVSKLEGWLDDRMKSDIEEEDPLIGRSISHFEILEPIGRGGMGMVYRAQDRALDRVVALKFLPPSLSSDADAKGRFIHEAKAASGLNHPNIATVHEIGETGDHQLFIAMGYYPGVTLKEKIEQGPMAPDEAVEIAIQLATGLKNAHEHGVIHRDIKPGNIMMTTEGTVVLLDFGLAKLSHESGYTQVGQMMGTIAYMSPEQARGETVDLRTDIWSFGVVLYELLAGQPPFCGDNVQTVIRAILEDDPEPPVAPDGEISERLKAVLGLCLAKDPGRRYQNAGDLLEDLQRVQEGLAPKKRGGRATWKRRSQRWRWVLAGGAVAAVALATMVNWSQRPTSEVVFTRITDGPLVEDTGNLVVASWGDYDGDGFIDVAVANRAEGSPIHLFHNEGDGTFTRVAEGVLATDPATAMSVAWADQDNDGDVDLFACSETGLDTFYRNDGEGVFTKVTEGEWVNTTGSGNAIGWGDYDNDGFVDLYVANFGNAEHESNFLYHNRSDGTMEAVRTEANALAGPSHGCLWTDYDADGDVDLFVTGQAPVQFRNNGDGTFTGVPQAPAGIPRVTEDVDVSFSSADYDNDGDLDLFYATWKADPSFLLYRNEGGLRFVDTTRILPSPGAIRSMGGKWGDYDNDGYLDLFITNRAGQNLLYHNEGNDTFTRVTDSPIVSEGRSSAGANWVDYDNDGDLDLLVVNGIVSTFPQSCELFRNEGTRNSWIVLNLVGTVSNRSAIGAKVRARALVFGKDLTQTREIQSGTNSSTGLRLHFGLGDATTINTLRIEWPSGQVQEMRNVAANQFLTITENTVGAGPSRAEVKSPSVTFTRITEGPLVEDKGNFLGVNWGDYDNDGFVDVVVGNNVAGKTSQLYHNEGDGTLTRVTEGVLATDPIGPMGSVWADQDNDGDLDLYTCVDLKSLDVFYRNEGHGAFSKVSVGAWLNVPNSTHHAAWGDYDNDGWVDLFVANSGDPGGESNFLYHNRGDGSMEAVETAVSELKGVSHGCFWSDFDGDGDVDLFVAGQELVQFRNEGGGSFAGVTRGDGGIPEYTGDADMGFSGADYDNDGDMDMLYIVWSLGSGSLLYRSDRGRVFTEVAHALPAEGQVRAIGAFWGDYDNDGFLDLYITNLAGKNLLYHNEGNGSFTRITDSPLVTESLRSGGGSWVDYDNDGDLDLFVANGMWSTFEQSCELYRNDGGTNHWIELILVGTVSNRSAIGAKVWARTRIDGQDVTQMREISGGPNNSGGLRAHFGLGDAATVDTLRIEWPSGIVQEFHDVAADRFLTITEEGSSG